MVMVSEPNEMKRGLAKKFGADVVLDPSGGEMGAAVREHTKGGGVEYLIEASGQGRAFAAISAVIRKQATVLLSGIGFESGGVKIVSFTITDSPHRRVWDCAAVSMSSRSRALCNRALRPTD